MRNLFLTACVAVVLGHGLATAAPSSTPMAPTAQWNVEFADRMCLLSRPYGKNGAISLFLKPSMIGEGLEIIVAEATNSVSDPVYGKAVLTVAGKAVDGDASFTAYSTAKTRLLRINLKDDRVALATVRGTLGIEAAREGRHLFSVAGIERALPVLSACIDQLRAAYKVSKADLAGIVTKPKVGLPSLFSSDDYPQDALSKGQFGTVGVLLWAEADGRVSTCEVIESSGAPSLDQTTCNIIQRRARYTPATTAAGTAVRSPSFARIRWQLPISRQVPSRSRP